MLWSLCQLFVKAEDLMEDAKLTFQDLSRFFVVRCAWEGMRRRFGGKVLTAPELVPPPFHGGRWLRIGVDRSRSEEGEHWLSNNVRIGQN